MMFSFSLNFIMCRSVFLASVVPVSQEGWLSAWWSSLVAGWEVGKSPESWSQSIHKKGPFSYFHTTAALGIGSMLKMNTHIGISHGVLLLLPGAFAVLELPCRERHFTGYSGFQGGPFGWVYPQNQKKSKLYSMSNLDFKGAHNPFNPNNIGHH